MGLGSFFKDRFRVERNRLGEFSYSFLNETGFENSDRYLQISLNNPVLMPIIALRAKIYSQMHITHVDVNGEEVKNSEILALFKQPNYFQSQEDFLFQQSWFLSATGNDLTYCAKAFNVGKAMYNLLPSAIDLNNTHKIDKLIITDADFKALEDKHIIYTIEGETHNYKLKDIIPFYDLSNGLEERSFMRSPSRVKGISKILENIEENLLAKNTNLKMTQKYLASSKGDGNSAHIKDEDRKDIFSKIGKNSLMITNTELDVKHLVSDMKKLALDPQFSEDALKCLLAFDMNSEVLNYFSGGASTYDNYNQATINWIQNFIQSDADKAMNSFSSYFGLFEKNEKLVASYNHLPVMAKLVNDKVASFKALQETLKVAVELGTMTIAEAKVMSDNFKNEIKL